MDSLLLHAVAFTYERMKEVPRDKFAKRFSDMSSFLPEEILQLLACQLVVRRE